MPDASPITDARALLRQWLHADEDGVVQAIDAIGRRAITSAADASARLSRGAIHTESAKTGLAEVEAVAQALDTPPPPSGWRSLFAAPPAPPVPARIDALVERLARERDGVARSILSLETDRDRFAAAVAALDEAGALIAALRPALEAAARELRHDRPERAAFLRETATERLLAREQDILTQSAVTRQGLLTIGILIDSHATLAQALARAQETSIAALRTAAAARGAVAGSRALADQARALDRAAAAADGSTLSAPAASRALGDAVMQARRAIAAIEGN
ncbi:toxic anion resistance protein [Sphingomonas sp. Leaf25]|uniref:toxic anion resistance protein n=1 Tax=Sphingomonas sp. Leaf25 TaxID=1735692 RepID=UPI0006F5DABD|nr:toxic anion resistance protein [Sphingomonas sp. Leaf25]KQN00478.1 hypothetical protein ASE78_05105 [Sphingomonas sp. Leaf25]